MKADSGPQEVTAPSTSCPGRDGGSASKVRPGTEFNSSWLCHLRGLERNSAALSPPWQCQQSRFSMIANTFPFKTVPKDTTSQYNPRSRYSLWRDHRLAQGNSKGLSVLPEYNLKSYWAKVLRPKYWNCWDASNPNNRSRKISVRQIRRFGDLGAGKNWVEEMRFYKSWERGKILYHQPSFFPGFWNSKGIDN